VQISGSTALVTGATGGIGQAIARALRERGARLILTGRRSDLLERLSAELDASALTIDLCLPHELERLIASADEVDILVANAGLPASGELDSFSQEEIDRALAVNLRAPILLARALVPRMTEHGRGHMVFISSLSGKVATPAASLYNATKFGLRGFAWALREELRERDIGVSAIFPGFISDAGMFVDADVKLPPGIGTRSPEEVAHAVLEAIERNRGAIDVAPLPLRASAFFANLAPGAAGSLARRLGSDKLSRELAEGQRPKR